MIGFKAVASWTGKQDYSGVSSEIGQGEVCWKVFCFFLIISQASLLAGEVETSLSGDC